MESETKVEKETDIERVVRLSRNIIYEQFLGRLTQGFNDDIIIENINFFNDKMIYRILQARDYTSSLNILTSMRPERAMRVLFYWSPTNFFNYIQNVLRLSPYTFRQNILDEYELWKDTYPLEEEKAKLYLPLLQTNL